MTSTHMRQITCWSSLATFACFVLVAASWMPLHPALGMLGIACSVLVGLLLQRRVAVCANGDVALTFVMPRARKYPRDEVVGVRLSLWLWLTTIDLSSFKSILIPGYLTRLRDLIEETRPAGDTGHR